jgi:hypothetical protein
MKWIFTLRRQSQNRLNPETARKHLKKIAEAASRNTSLGFHARVGRLGEPATVFDEARRQDGYQYEVRLQLVKEQVRNPETVADKVRHVLGVLGRCASQYDWELLSPPGPSLLTGQADESVENLFRRGRARPSSCRS